MKTLAIGLIKFYQKNLSPGSNPGLFSGSHRCRFYPSCSEYSIGAIKKHGLFKGIIKSLFRIFRCGPWSLGGIDHP